MTTVLARAGAVVFSAVAMLALLLGLAALALGHPERTAAYLVVTILSGAVVALLMRRDVRRRREQDSLRGGQAPRDPPARAHRRARRPISFPIRETGLAFVFWYAATAAIDRIITGELSVFTLVAIAPFASFMLTALTIAGRHMAFRLTDEEDE